MPRSLNQKSTSSVNDETLADFAFSAGIAHSQRIDLVKAELKNELRRGASHGKKLIFSLIKRVIKGSHQTLGNAAEKLATKIESKSTTISPKSRTSTCYKKSF